MKFLMSMFCAVALFRGASSTSGKRKRDGSYPTFDRHAVDQNGNALSPDAEPERYPSPRKFQKISRTGRTTPSEPSAGFVELSRKLTRMLSNKKVIKQGRDLTCGLRAVQNIVQALGFNEFLGGNVDGFPNNIPVNSGNAQNWLNTVALHYKEQCEHNAKTFPVRPPGRWTLYWPLIGFYDKGVVAAGLRLGLRQNYQIVPAKYFPKKDDPLAEQDVEWSKVHALVFNANSPYTTTKHWWSAAKCPETGCWYEMDSKCPKPNAQPILVNGKHLRRAKEVAEYMMNHPNPKVNDMAIALVAKL